MDGETEEEGGEEIDDETFSARSGQPCAGCPEKLDSESAKKWSAFALTALEKTSNSDKVQKIIRIVKATSQVSCFYFRIVTLIK